jgi:protein-tyrosine phosphatase
MTCGNALWEREGVAVDAADIAPLQGAFNFRDLGGHLTADGRRVRRGAVFRSAPLDTLTDTDRAALGGLGLRTIVDFRGKRAAEISRNNGLACEVVVARFDPGVGDRITDAVAGGMATPHRMMEIVTEIYRDFPARCVPGFRTLLATLSDGRRRPTVILCHFGKDRTGFASALLLALLGVPWDKVVEDYLKSNDWSPGLIGFHPELDADTRISLFQARASYMEVVFDLIRADFGSPESFAERALGFDGAALRHLKVELLDQP